ncbi:hypothetical protein DYH09_02755 [bacterium CPR1]|nr:hypothetical protein [bacterium CPR1]
MVAVGVFATAFLLLLGVFPTATRAIRQANEYLTASFLAEQELEAVRGLAFEDIANVSPREVTVQTTNRGITADARYTVEVDVDSPPLKPELKKVRVLVSWTRERPRSLELSTYVADY